MKNSLAGWRLPLRLARRDLRRYTGRNVLAGLLIALPLFVIAGLVTGVFTLTLQQRERDDITFAKAQTQLTFDLSGTAASTGDVGAPTTAATPLPGASKPASPDNLPTLAQVQAVSGGRASSSLSGSVGTKAGTRTAQETYEQVGGDETLWRSQFDLVDGRWPSSDDEALVTLHGRGKKLPATGDVTIDARGSKRTLHVVGVVMSHSETSLVSTARMPGLANPTFLLDHDHATAERWATYGAQARTRGTYAGGAPPDATQVATMTVAAMITIGIIALLAGPAFAASATRSRRMLGIIASNGANPPLLRRIVLTQALVVGVVSAVVGVALGTLAGGLTASNAYRLWPGVEPGPFDVRWRALIAMVLVASVASIVAASVPAFVAGRTNLLTALRGQVSPRRVRRRMPALGLLFVLAGIGLLFMAAHAVNDQSGSGVAPIVLGIPLFFIGGVMIIPGVLSLWGRAADHLPLTLRIAIRDVSRQRTRATAAVGSVLAVTTGFATIAIFAASIDAHMARTYSYSAPMGSTSFPVQSLRGGERGFLTDGERLVPGLRSAAVRTLGTDPGIGFDAAERHDTKAHMTNAFFDVTACTPEAIAHSAGSAFGALGPITGLPTVVALDTSTPWFAHLSEAQRAVLDDGGALVVSGGPKRRVGADTQGSMRVPATAIHDGRLSLAAVTTSDFDTSTPFNAKKVACATHDLEATTVDEAAFSHTPSLSAGTVVMTTRTAHTAGLPMSDASLYVTAPGGLTDAQAARLSTLATDDYTHTVERGYHSMLLLVLLIGTGATVLLILLAAVVSTLLTAAESQAESATMAAVGAPRGMRRRIMAAHAGAIAVIGILTGYALGAGPGVVLAVTNTSKNHFDFSEVMDPIVRVPWVYLGFVLLVVPLTAALVVAIGVRRPPTLTRRDA